MAISPLIVDGLLMVVTVELSDVRICIHRQMAGVVVDVRHRTNNARTASSAALRVLHGIIVWQRCACSG